MKKNNKLYLFFVFLIGVFLGVFITFIYIHHPKDYTSKDNKALIKYDTEKIYGATEKICKNNESCYTKQFQKITLKYDYTTAFAVLKKLVHEKPKFSFCHFMAHSIGQGAYEKDPKNWQTTMNQIPQDCSYGAFHGMLEAYSANLRKKNESLISKNILTKICENQIPSCGHIIGHILLVETRANIPKAITACEAFKGAYYTWCVNGIFMEYAYPKTLVQHGLSDNSKLVSTNRLPEFSSYCSSFKDPKISSICWGEISRGAIADYKSDWGKIFDFCDSAPAPISSETCKNRTVEMLSVSSNFEIMHLKPICKLGKDTAFERGCYSRLVGGKATNQIDIEDDSLVSFCNSLEVELQKSCFVQIGTALKRRSIKIEAVNVICKSAPSKYQSFCRGKQG